MIGMICVRFALPGTSSFKQGRGLLCWPVHDAHTALDRGILNPKGTKVMNEAPYMDRAFKGRPLVKITPGERQALQLIAQGRAIGEVGQCLGVPPSQLGFHLAELFAKLGAATDVEAIAEAARRGIVDT
jgi:DNA-binding CsgD family transcriptional regulator